jgi:hypothetical protein
MSPHIRSDDPLPVGAIRLSEAYRLYYRAKFPEWETLENTRTNVRETIDWKLLDEIYAEWKAAKDGSSEKYIAHKKLGPIEEPVRKANAAVNEIHKKAEAAFRKKLASDGPAAMIYDPEKDKTLELKREDWLKGRNFPAGFSTNFVSPGDLVQPGPLAQAGGKLRPVFFWKAEFETFLAAPFSQVTKKSRTETRKIPEPPPGKRVQRVYWRALQDKYPHGIPKSPTHEVKVKVDAWIKAHQDDDDVTFTEADRRTLGRLLKTAVRNRQTGK